MWNGKSGSCPVYSNPSSSKIYYFSKCKFIKFLCPISVFNELIFFFRIFLISATAIQAWLWVLLKPSASSKVLQVELFLFARWSYSARQKKKQNKRQSNFYSLLYSLNYWNHLISQWRGKVENSYLVLFLYLSQNCSDVLEQGKEKIFRGRKMRNN